MHTELSNNFHVSKKILQKYIFSRKWFNSTSNFSKNLFQLESHLHNCFLMFCAKLLTDMRLQYTHDGLLYLI